MVSRSLICRLVLIKVYTTLARLVMCASCYAPYRFILHRLINTFDVCWSFCVHMNICRERSVSLADPITLCKIVHRACGLHCMTSIQQC